MTSKIEKLFETVDDDDQNKVFDYLFDKVMVELENYKSEEFEYESDTAYGLTEKKEIEKMINAGYRFNSGVGLSVQIEKDKRERKESTERKLKEIEEKRKQQQRENDKLLSSEWKEIANKLAIPSMRVNKTDDGKYNVRSYEMGIDATYDSISGKVSGKGSRGFKNEIIECATRYIELEKRMVSEKEVS